MTLLLYCPCLYCFSFFVIVCGLFEWKRIYAVLTPPHLCACHKPWRGFPTPDVVVFFVLSEKVRGDCSFCWYWLNCWPSLFKLSFHDFSYIVLLLPLTVNQLILQRLGFHLFVIYNKYNFKTTLMAFIFKLWYNREYFHLSANWLDIRNILIDIPFSMTCNLPTNVYCIDSCS